MGWVLLTARLDELRTGDGELFLLLVVLMRLARPFGVEDNDDDDDVEDDEDDDEEADDGPADKDLATPFVPLLVFAF